MSSRSTATAIDFGPILPNLNFRAPSDNFVVRLFERNRTRTSSNSPIKIYTHITGARYVPSPVENLVQRATSHVDSIGRALGPINSDLENLVDSLVEEAYVANAKPLTRSV